MGLEAFERASEGTEDWPIVGIGGIGVERAESVVAAGAHGVAAVGDLHRCGGGQFLPDGG